jgi:dynein heavy chain
MDWFSKWPKDALIAVSGHFLNNYHIVCGKEIKEQVINTMGVVHDDVASVCVEYFQRFVSLNIYLSMLVYNMCLFVKND